MRSQPSAIERIFRSRVVFGVLAFALVVLIVLAATEHGRWNRQLLGFFGGLIVVCGLALIGMYDVDRFRWALRTAAGLIFLVGLAGFCYQLAGRLAWLDGEFEVSLVQVVGTFIAITVPCGIFAFTGRFPGEAR